MKLWAGEVTLADVLVLAWASTVVRTTRVHTRLCDPPAALGAVLLASRLIEEASQVLRSAQNQ